MIVPFQDWRPDSPNFGADMVTVTGCVPLTKESYGPFPTLATISDALGARCQGGGAFLDSSNNVNVFAADATKLYKLGSTTWADVSQAGDYTIGSASTIQFIQHSTATNRIIAAGDINTNMQTYVLGSSTLFADLSAAAPRARYIALIHPGIPIVGNTYDATDGYVQNRVWWPDITNNDPTSWPTIGSAAAQAAQSDYRDLAFGGPVTALTGPVGGAASGLVFCRKAIYRIVYAGPPSVYEFFALSYSLGTPCSNSVVNIRDKVFFVAEDGFYMCDGSGIYPIGAQKVDKYFWGRVDQAYLNRVYGAADPLAKVVYWSAPDGTNSGGDPSFILAYNYELDRWSMPETGGALEFMFNGYSVGYTLDDLDAFGTIDTLPYPLWSPAWQGGRPIIGGFYTDHKYGSFSGSAAAVTIDGGEFTGDGGKRPRLRGWRPIVDGSGTGITCTVGYRDTPYGTVIYDTGVTVGADGVAPLNRSARFLRPRMQISAGQSFTHIYGLEPVLSEEGTR